VASTVIETRDSVSAIISLHLQMKQLVNIHRKRLPASNCHRTPKNQSLLHHSCRLTTKFNPEHQLCVQSCIPPISKKIHQSNIQASGAYIRATQQWNWKVIVNILQTNFSFRIWDPRIIVSGYMIPFPFWLVSCFILFFSESNKNS
jgi:hypothetical protein